VGFCIAPEVKGVERVLVHTLVGFPSLYKQKGASGSQERCVRPGHSKTWAPGEQVPKFVQAAARRLHEPRDGRRVLPLLTQALVNRTQALVNRTQALVNRTQARVNRTQARVNRTQARVNRTQGGGGRRRQRGRRHPAATSGARERHRPRGGCWAAGGGGAQEQGRCCCCCCCAVDAVVAAPHGRLQPACLRDGGAGEAACGILGVHAMQLALVSSTKGRSICRPLCPAPGILPPERHAISYLPFIRLRD
jgi:hypothetical protein